MSRTKAEPATEINRRFALGAPQRGISRAQHAYLKTLLHLPASRLGELLEAGNNVTDCPAVFAGEKQTGVLG
jgi:hypothetical protein